jgi:hypothetical protein
LPSTRRQTYGHFIETKHAIDDALRQLINFTLVVAQYPDMNNTFYWNQSAASLFSVAYAPGPGRE